MLTPSERHAARRCQPLGRTHNGVLLPRDMNDAPTAELDAYAAQVKRDNRAFIDAALALEDAALRHGVTLD